MYQYRNYDWLKKKLEEGLSIDELAKECDASIDTIQDWAINRFNIISWPNKKKPPKKRSNLKISRYTRIVILGASGFVGQNLCNFLKNKSGTIIEIDRKDADLMDFDDTHRVLKAFEPDVVVNLGAFCGGIGLNKDNPALMMRKNLQMGLNVVHACYLCDVKKLVFLGSVCSYPKQPEHIPFIEDDLWSGRPEQTNEPYGIAKKTIGFMLGAYRKQYDLSSAYLVPTNMYGPFDDFSPRSSHVIPAMIRKVFEAKKNKEDLILWGDGSPTRDFLFVGDCCRMIWLAIKSISDPEPINVGSGKETSMKKLVRTVKKIMRFNGRVRWDDSMPNGQPRRCLNISKTKSLGFKPMISLESGIKRTASWYKKSISS